MTQLIRTPDSSIAQINTRVYHPGEWQDLLDQNDAFVSDFLARTRLEIMKKQNEFVEFGRDQP